MWAEPNSFSVVVGVSVFVTVTVSAVGVPFQGLPGGWHIVFSFVATKGNPQQGIVAISDGPFSNIVCDGKGFLCV